MPLPKGIVALRLAPSAPGGEGPPETRCVPLAPLEIKEIQRRAFDRGRACEREELGARLAGLLQGLSASLEALDERRRKDREELARFGVDLALAVAESLVGRALAAGAHDARRLAETLLEEALPGLGAGALEIAVNPADLEAVRDLGREGASAAPGRLRVVGDAALPRAACRIRAGGAEVLADPGLRLQAIAERLRGLAAGEAPDA
jgi:flagellar biosynthesis/type III secretory pathway protein FliH